jgi:hypothetical protein
MKSLFDYLGRAAGKQLGLEVAIYARQQKTQIETRQVSNPVYSGNVNLYTEDFLLSFFNNPNYRELIKEDKEWYENKMKNKVKKVENIEDNLPF